MLGGAIQATKKRPVLQYKRQKPNLCSSSLQVPFGESGMGPALAPADLKVCVWVIGWADGEQALFSGLGTEAEWADDEQS